MSNNNAGRGRFDAFILDMDGVIVNSNPLHRLAWEIYNRGFGIDTTEEMQQRMYGKRNDEIVRDFFGTRLNNDQVYEHGAAKERLYREMMGSRIEDALVPGVKAFLHRHRDMPMAVATNAEPANVDFILEQAHLREYFRGIVDGHQVENAKPHPEVFLRAADLLGVEHARCLVFEDSHAGVQAGLAAGMTVVGLATTHQDLPGVSVMIEDFDRPELEIFLVS
jgi:beta-phosphoglucomutase